MQMIGVFGPEVAAQIAQKNLDVDKLFKWLWDLFNNDPDILRSEEDREAANSQEQTAQGLQMAAPAADMALKGSGAVRNIADAGAKGGIDIGQLIQQFQGEVQQNPRAQLEMKALMNGQAPPPA
jgi:hypothetical protein